MPYSALKSFFGKKRGGSLISKKYYGISWEDCEGKTLSEIHFENERYIRISALKLLKIYKTNNISDKEVECMFLDSLKRVLETPYYHDTYPNSLPSITAFRMTRDKIKKRLYDVCGMTLVKNRRTFDKNKNIIRLRDDTESVYGNKGQSEDTENGPSYFTICTGLGYYYIRCILPKTTFVPEILKREIIGRKEII
jgi:hypothetical protein